MATTEAEKPSKRPETEDATSQSPESKKRKSVAVDEIEVDLEAPEPPSKRAKRLLKKGKKLPPKVDSDDEREAKKKEKEEKEQAVKARSEHGVWIGNLPFFVTADELRKWLIANSGEMITEESITRLHLPTTKQAGRDKPSNKGFAYVDFNDVAPKVAAIALTEAELGHRKLLIKDSKSFEGRPKKEEETAGAAAAAAKEEVPKSSKIFIGNLSFKTTDDDVWQHFEKCGQIDWVKVATFEDTGKCKGYGWVKFREPESAGWAVKGFVKIKEEIETEDDFVEAPKDKDGDEDMEEAEGDDDAAKEKKGAAAEEPRFKMRKWWVNKLLGRMLKIELAEDDQTRYKKRFGKDAPKRQQQQNGEGAEGADGAEGAPVEERKPRAPRPPRTEKPKPAAGELKAQDDILVARLTGAAAKHTGTKITFD
ncbi:Putative RNA recognition motif domain, nucleotide-binding alpha-beta plait domain superfamily [Colletotrichum destructivum]|uniref:RNA recognition motif domain, nucleotide-binding alpha-beta plait domain superfamily n=1 Tax=Colletotrichum destructivum TaxID=34406 RepID=A0AAX4IZE2_9PEZI|nr:Putative RNA recognition motif domain, nucleotide-binding alpha-beta plait domain superfamily [Colletotrichum destructivum]